MKNILKLVLCFLSIATFSQKNFFETIESHGSEAVYQRYYSVYKDDKGNQQIKGKQYKLKTEILTLDGVYSGIKLLGATKEDKSGINTIDATKSKSSKIIGYPNVSHLVDRVSRKGFVAIDDFIFKIGGVWKEKDGVGFNDIDEIYIRVGASGDSNDKKSKKTKKKKFGAFMSKLKDAALNKAPQECTSPACKKALKMDLKKHVRDYLLSMKSKQDAYTLTAKDKADIAKINNAVNGYYQMVDKKNEAYWNSEEGKAIKRNKENYNSAKQKHLRECKTRYCENSFHKY
ncbi:hypothetical protein [uncultured Polaribacter sp.]|uniref:hypothetical protein n=1 Tax=uncultured Polaribacter sp. TaxID=174711 RepID=UPI00261BD247|nr:hypothetical protein [uncultured Polaribacter sp.]